MAEYVPQGDSYWHCFLPSCRLLAAVAYLECTDESAVIRGVCLKHRAAYLASLPDTSVVSDERPLIAKGTGT